MTNPLKWRDFSPQKQTQEKPVVKAVKEKKAKRATKAQILNLVRWAEDRRQK